MCRQRLIAGSLDTEMNVRGTHRPATLRRVEPDVLDVVEPLVVRLPDLDARAPDGRFVSSCSVTE